MFFGHDFGETELMENLTELAIQFDLYKNAEKSKSELNDFYSNGISNLKHFAPNLKILHPIGGHFYFPENGVSFIKSIFSFDFTDSRTT